MEYTVNLYLQNNCRNHSEKWLSSILFCISGLKYFVALRAHYLKENKLIIVLFGNNSSLNHWSTNQTAWWHWREKRTEFNVLQFTPTLACTNLRRWGAKYLVFVKTRELSFCSVCILYEESVFIFQFLNDKIHNHVKQNIIVNSIFEWWNLQLCKNKR